MDTFEGPQIIEFCLFVNANKCKQNRVCPFRLAPKASSKLARYAYQPPFYVHNYLANKRLPLTTATLSEVYPIWQQSMSVNWIDDGIEYITVGALRLRMDI